MGHVKYVAKYHNSAVDLINSKLSECTLPAPIVVHPEPIVPLEPDWHVVMADHGNLCLDVGEGSVQPGARLILWERHGKDNQKFRFRNDGRLEAKCGLVLGVQHDRSVNKLYIVLSLEHARATHQQYVYSKQEWCLIL